MKRGGRFANRLYQTSLVAMRPSKPLTPLDGLGAASKSPGAG